MFHLPLPWFPAPPAAGLTCLPLRTHAGEGRHTVNAGGARGAGRKGTVVDVFTAVVSAPAIHTHATIAPIAVGAGASVLTGIGLQQALIHVLGTELSFWKKEPLMKDVRSRSICIMSAPVQSSP